MKKLKKVAKSLKSTATDPVVKKIVDRSFDIEEITEQILGMWKFDLFSRKPGRAYNEDGILIGTDLDLAVLLYTLQDRKAVVKFPNYKGMGAKTKTEGIHKFSDSSYGPMLGLTSNKDFFKFSVRIKDMTLVSSDEVGQYRTFSVTRHDGKWYDGWNGIEFLPDAKENDFIVKSKIFADNKICFKNFVHPNRWLSFYGKPYFMTKLLIQRLEEECKNLHGQAKRMATDGFKLPDSETTFYPKSTTVGETKSIKVMAFNAEIDFPDNGSEYPVFESNEENLIAVIKKRKHLLNTVLPSLRFITRVTENAFMNHIDTIGLNAMPAWLKNATWEEGYREKGKRTDWNRLVLYQPAVGELGVSLRFRQYLKSVKVDVNYTE